MLLLSPVTPNLLDTLRQPPALHIPDGFLGVTISVILWFMTILLLATAIKKTENNLGERQIPLMGIMAAFIFAGQMINFPVAGGTSGHLLGGALAAIVLGPWAGMIVLASVVGLQALLFQDGGLLVMGANIFNMGILTALIGFGVYRGFADRGNSTRLAVAAVAAWLSVMGAAFATSLQLWLSGTSPLQIVLPAMLGVHALIGIGEALITVAALAFIMKTRPDLLSDDSVRSRGGRGWIAAGIAVALVVILFAPLASANPDGLERVAEDIGFIQTGLDAPFDLLPNYTVPFLGDTTLSTIAAGLVGTLLVAAIALGLGRLLNRPKPSRPSPSPKVASGS